MTNFIRGGNGGWYVRREGAMIIKPALPAAVYAVRYDSQQDVHFLEAISDFTVPSKFYGDLETQAARIIGTFKARSAATGVMLAGEKGSGKTLLAKKVAMDLIADGIPVIVVSEPFAGEDFNSFIQSIDQPAVVLFDEFEKVYDDKQQPKLLTLLDGVFNSKKLFMLTINNVHHVDRHMKNRPGRLFYALTFQGLTSAFILEYCQDNLNDKSYINKVLELAKLFAAFNFDMLQALVEDMNRYNESPAQALKYLNIQPTEDDAAGAYLVTVDYRGVILPETKIRCVLFGRSDIDFRVDGITVGLTKEEAEKREDYDGPVQGRPWYGTIDATNDFVSYDANTESYLFVDQDGVKYSVKRAPYARPYYERMYGS